MLGVRTYTESGSGQRWASKDIAGINRVTKYLGEHEQPLAEKRILHQGRIIKSITISQEMFFLLAAKTVYSAKALAPQRVSTCHSGVSYECPLR